MSFVVDWAKEKAYGYALAGIQAGGSLAGNAVGGVGNVIEQGGRQFGEGTVTGGIRGVGGYINGYGDSIKASMAADGPSTAQKKVAVKPGDAKAKAPAAPKALPSAGGAPKALPSTGGAKKALPAPSSPKVGGAPKPSTAVGAAKPPTGGKLPDGKVRVSAESRPKPGGMGTAKSATAGAGPKASAGMGGAKPLTSKTAPDGKVRIDPASRPKLPAKK